MSAHPVEVTGLRKEFRKLEAIGGPLMFLIQRLLSRMFPLMAITGLLLAGWGLIITPEDMKSNAQGALMVATVSPSIDASSLNP